MARKLTNPIKNARAIVSIIKSRIKGRSADRKRGKLLHKQGVRGISAVAKARKGKTKRK